MVQSFPYHFDCMALANVVAETTATTAAAATQQGSTPSCTSGPGGCLRVPLPIPCMPCFVAWSSQCLSTPWGSVSWPAEEVTELASDWRRSLRLTVS
jgi:hypothetical protein